MNLLPQPLRLAPDVVVGKTGVHRDALSLEFSPQEMVVVELLRQPRAVPELLSEIARMPAQIPPVVVVRTLLRLQGAGLLEGAQSPLAVPVPGARQLVPLLRLVPTRLWQAFALLLVSGALLRLALWLQDPHFLGQQLPMATEEIVVTVCAMPFLLLLFRALIRGLTAHVVELAAGRERVRLRWQSGAELPQNLMTPQDRQRAQAVATSGLVALALPFLLLSLLVRLNPLPVLQLALWLNGLYLLLATAPALPTDARTLLGLSLTTPVLGRDARAWLIQRSLRNLLTFRKMSPVEESYARVASLMLAHTLLAWLLTTHRLLPWALDLMAAAVRRGQSVLVALPTVLALLWLLVLALGILGLLLEPLRQAGALRALLRPKSAQLHLPLEPAESETLLRAARQLPFFSALGARTLDTLPPKMERETYQPGQAILRQGDPGDRLCCLVGGHALVEREDAAGVRHAEARLNPGDFFGETALLLETPRTAHVLADGHAVVATLSRAEFLELVTQSGADPQEIQRQVRHTAALQGHPLFVGLLGAELRTVVAETQTLHFEAGQTLVHEGDANCDLYVLLAGTCQVLQGGLPLGKLEVRDWFGELALLTDLPRQATVTALTPVDVLRVPSAVAIQGLGRDPGAAERLWEVAAERLAVAQNVEKSALPAGGSR